MKSILIAGASLAVMLAAGQAWAQDAAPASQSEAALGFFVTSTGLGAGADLGGLEGADAHCQMLADAAGAGDRSWAAYLSAMGVNARDRIGSGPWANANGEIVAESVEDLHSEDNNVTAETAVTETGDPVPGRGQDPNQHDILTGSNADGTFAEGMTCDDWTSSGEGSAMVGHHDRAGPETLATGTSWNAAHPSRGCGQEALIGTGGNGYFYCFATDEWPMAAAQ